MTFSEMLLKWPTDSFSHFENAIGARYALTYMGRVTSHLSPSPTTS